MDYRIICAWREDGNCFLGPLILSLKIPLFWDLGFGPLGFGLSGLRSSGCRLQGLVASGWG